MSFAWSHTTYAIWHNMIFNFEWKTDLKYFLAHADGAKRICAKDAWDMYHNTDRKFIRVYASSALGKNSYRKKRVKNWYDNK